MRCWRVASALPERRIVGLTAGLVDPSVGRLRTSLSTRGFALKSVKGLIALRALVIIHIQQAGPHASAAHRAVDWALQADTRDHALQPAAVCRPPQAASPTFLNSVATFIVLTRMWANAQRDGRPAEHRWRPLFNAAKFG